MTDSRAGETPRGSWLDRLCTDAGPLAELIPGCALDTVETNR